MEGVVTSGLFSQLVKLCFYLLALRGLVVYTYRWLISPLSHIPGPFPAKFSDWYGAYYSALGSLHLRTLEAHERYGSVVRIGPNKISFNTISALHTIYSARTLQKTEGYVAMLPSPRVYNVHNVIDKDVHRFKRKIINQGLSEQRMRDFEPAMNNQIDIFIQNIRRACKESEDEWSEPINMTTPCKYLGYDIMGQFGFGQSFQLQIKPDNRFLVESINLSAILLGVYFQFADLVKARLHVVFASRALKLRKELQALMERIVSERVTAEKHSQHDLFSFVIDAKDPESGRGFSFTELWAEGRLLLIAGSDTSSTTITSLFFYLSRYPECYKKLASEIRGSFDHASDIHSSMQMVECIYLRACIDETLRMSPPVGGTMWRKACPGSGGIVIDGQCIPEGVELGCSAYALHHNEEYFPDSFTFKPERWIVSTDTSKESVDLARRAFAPFSLGTRGCAGRTMAYMETSNVIAKTIWYFDFTVAGGHFGTIGEGSSDGPEGRKRMKEFQLEDHFTSTHEGPYLQFKLRKEVADQLPR
ncbi:cytochrome P450 [Lindgomyces ingoldianus]|uniref:Cytochrome P450 n=1 Tax=Lindgomyces ingoldianus TaxID=673940 RepID=A0ACB6R3G6_9PLEO|nr:cytochrome P450 [Lindgomyces ingoldianus]KAF2473640.1 cytochrome P450 [Lindgomyces ingoldianus]